MLTTPLEKRAAGKTGATVVRNVSEPLHRRADSSASPERPCTVPPQHTIVGLTKVAALDYAASRVRVNCVAPGVVATPMLARFLQNQPELIDQLAAAHPIGRIASAEEVAASMLFLASEKARYVTGQTLAIDGGYHYTVSPDAWQKQRDQAMLITGARMMQGRGRPTIIQGALSRAPSRGKAA